MRENPTYLFKFKENWLFYKQVTDASSAPDWEGKRPIEDNKLIIFLSLSKVMSYSI